MVGVIDFVTDHDLLMEFIGKQPNAVISILKMKKASNSVITFLNNHKELFDFLVLVSKYMRKVDPMKYSGEDLKAEDVGVTIGQNKRFFISRRTLSYLVLVAIITIVVVVVFAIVL